ncbi:hypothetical protein PtB15_7B614 [Puccinia triticina]|nr:hypothetical protein PtB15_7B614 [Puccinia triticina]
MMFLAKPSTQSYTCQGVKFGSALAQAKFCCNLEIPPLNYAEFTRQEVTQNFYPA